MDLRILRPGGSATCFSPLPRSRQAGPERGVGESYDARFSKGFPNLFRSYFLSERKWPLMHHST